MVKTENKATRPTVAAGMKDREFTRFAEFIHRECGIKLPLSKKTMVEARLQKRLRVLEMKGFTDYCAFVFSPEGLESELVHLIDVITTNTTEFYREPRHFDILNAVVLPEWFAANRGRGRLRVWSAGCSTGEEPYTLAMVLSEFALKNDGFGFEIMATDISTNVLQRAFKAVYPEDKIEGMSMDLKKKYILRSKDRKKQLVRIAPELRRMVTFKRLNFMDNFSFRNKMDIIFSRNVLIYFDRPTQEGLLRKFCANLRRGGHVFIGHSESLTGMDLPLRQIAPTVYVGT